MLQLVSLLSVEHAERVEVLGAPNFELHGILAPLDFHRAGILPSCSKEEILDLMDLLRLRITNWHGVVLVETFK